MANNEIDYKIIEKQLAILMTNSVAYASKLYDLFVSSTPMDIEFNVWTSVDTFETIKVPNRAKGNVPASYGSGSPEGNVEANYGAIYLDETDGSLYIKTTMYGNDGWLKLITESELSAHDNSSTAHDGVLAKIDGAYSNGVPSTFIVADAIEGVSHPTTELDDDYYAINKGSLFKLLGGLENLETEDNSTIVNSINETFKSTKYDSGCVVNAAKNSITNNPSFMYLAKDETGEWSIKLEAPFVITNAAGKNYTFTENIQANIINSIKETGLVVGERYSIYLDLEPILGNIGRVLLLKGKYYKNARKPYVLALYDGWLDTSSSPYRFISIEKDEFNKLVEVEHNYVYLGELQYDGGAD